MLLDTLLILISFLAFIIDPVVQNATTRHISFKRAEKVFVQKVNLAQEALEKGFNKSNIRQEKYFNKKEKRGGYEIP